jgi:hypothetical protein
VCADKEALAVERLVHARRTVVAVAVIRVNKTFRPEGVRLNMYGAISACGLLHDAASSTRSAVAFDQVTSSTGKLRAHNDPGLNELYALMWHLWVAWTLSCSALASK